MKIKNSPSVGQRLPMSVKSFALAIALFSASPIVRAVDYSWDPSTTGGIQYGDGTWDPSTTNWTTDGGASNIAWVNGTGNNAAFSSAVTGTPPALVAVTLGANITLQQLTMGGSYNANVLVSGVVGGYSLTFGGVSPVISNNSTSKYLEIDAIVAGSNINLQKTNSGVVILSQNNTYTGTTTIQGNASSNGGVLQIGSGGATGALGAGDVIIKQASGQTGASTLRFNRSDAVTVSNNISITDAVNGGIVEQSGNNTLTLSGTQALTGSVNYKIGATAAISGLDTVISGQITGAGNFTKSGNGTLQLAGNNSYVGTTTVSAGTLLIDGDQSSSTGAVSVASGAVLGGTGVSGAVATISGTLAPGSGGIGLLTTGGLSFTSTGALSVELGRSSGVPSNDSVAVNGAVSLATGSELKLTLHAGMTSPIFGDTFYLVNNDGVDAVSGVFTSLNGGATSLGEGDIFTWNFTQYKITYLANFGSSFTGGNDIAIQAVPEPSTVGLIGLGFVFILWIIRRPSRVLREE